MQIRGKAMAKVQSVPPEGVRDRSPKITRKSVGTKSKRLNRLNQRRSGSMSQPKQKIPSPPKGAGSPSGCEGKTLKRLSTFQAMSEEAQSLLAKFEDGAE